MKFEHDDSDLSITLSLDRDDPPDLDLTHDRLGEACLTAAVDELLLSFGRETDPDGRPWEPLKSRTIQEKGGDWIGVRTGAMLASLNAGLFEIAEREATWSFPDGPTWDRASAFHNGRQSVRGGADVQVARPLVGWTAAAEAECRRLVAARI